MKIPEKQVRVFIISTFRDMPFDGVQGRHAERDHLVTVVFPYPSTSLRAGLRPPLPRLRRAGERVEELGLEFFDVDLRFRLRPSERDYGGQGGVPEKTLDGEKANSWAYCNQWIDRGEPFFVCLLGQRYGFVPDPQQIRDEADRQAYATLSITEMEIRHAVLAGRIRRRSFFYLRQTLVPDQADAAAKAEFVEDEAKFEQFKALIKMQETANGIDC